MNSFFIYAFSGAGLVTFGLYALIVHVHLLRKILAINVMSSGVFLLLVALARDSGEPVAADPVLQAMVITGIVVAVSATALALVLMLKFYSATGQTQLHDDSRE